MRFTKTTSKIWLVILCLLPILAGGSPQFDGPLFYMGVKIQPYHILGLHKHPIHERYMSIKDRCYNKNFHHYHRYGGRGISVCPEWLNDFMLFYTWCVQNGWRRGLQLDRINNDGNYCPENCRFTTARVNSNNRSDTIMVILDGERMPFRFACDRLGVKAKLVWQTMNRKGLSFDASVAHHKSIQHV